MSLTGVVPLSWSLDHAGPMARTVEDVALLFSVIAGQNPSAPAGDIKGIRIGVPRSYFFDRIAPDVDSAVRTALKCFEKLGARIAEVHFPSASLQ